MKLSMRCTLRFGREQEGVIECVSEFGGGNLIAPEMSNSDNVRRDDAILHKMSACGEGDVYNPVEESKARNSLEKYERRKAGVCNRDFSRRDLFGLVGFVGHDGVSLYYDKEQSCWLPITRASATANQSHDNRTPTLRIVDERCE